LIAKGAHLDWDYYRPKPVPDEQNIMKAPIMEAWFIKDSPLTNTAIAKRTANSSTPCKRRAEAARILSEQIDFDVIIMSREMNHLSGLNRSGN